MIYTAVAYYAAIHYIARASEQLDPHDGTAQQTQNGLLLARICYTDLLIGYGLVVYVADVLRGNWRYRQFSSDQFNDQFTKCRGTDVYMPL